MHRPLLRILIFLAALCVGLYASSLSALWSVEPLPRSAYRWTAEKLDDGYLRYQQRSESWNLAEGMFYRTARSCGRGFYEQDYIAYDGSNVSSGASHETPEQFLSLAMKGDLIASDKDLTQEGIRDGVRLILRKYNGNIGDHFVEIIEYDGSDEMHFFSGPNLAITLELEDWVDREMQRRAK